MAEVRYLVHDVDAAVTFYTVHLGFSLDQQYGRAMAILVRGDLTRWLAGPMASGSRPMPDGTQPGPGGWSRIVLRVVDLEQTVEQLRENGVGFRNEIVSGPGGRQILCLDPSGNTIELFEPA